MKKPKWNPLTVVAAQHVRTNNPKWEYEIWLPGFSESGYPCYSVALYVSRLAIDLSGHQTKLWELAQAKLLEYVKDRMLERYHYYLDMKMTVGIPGPVVYRVKPNGEVEWDHLYDCNRGPVPCRPPGNNRRWKLTMQVTKEWLESNRERYKDMGERREDQEP